MTLPMRSALISLAVCCLPGLARPQAFIDVAASRGLGIPPTILQHYLDRGACWGDFDGDGDQDLFLAGVLGQQHRYFQNTGSGYFTEIPGNVPGLADLSRATVAGDVDNDGALDVYLCNFGTANRLFLNDGTGFFTEQGALAGVDHVGGGLAASFGDYDRDGWLDLYVGNHLGLNGLPDANVLYHNDGDGTFTDVTATAGVGNTGLALTVLFMDFDGDGWPDIHVGNDRGTHPLYLGNACYHNNGDGTFSDVTVQVGAAIDMDAMGSDYLDVLNDGGWDVAISNDPPLGHVLQVWDPSLGAWSNQAAGYGVQGLQNGWAISFLDFDDDGWQDIYVCHDVGTGTGTNMLFHNTGPGTVWPEVGAARGLDLTGHKYSFTTADFDDDGRVDVLQLRSNGNALLMRNMVATGNWLKVHTVGTRSNRDGLGAVVEVSAGGLVQRQAVRSGSGFLGGNDLRLHFGLGAATSASLRIRWPSGQIQLLQNVAANQVLEVREPELSLTAPAVLGASTALQLSLPDETGLPWLMVLSAGTQPGYPLTGGRRIPVAYDALLFLALSPGNPVLPQATGLIGPSGTAQAPLTLPFLPSLAGTSIHASALTVAPGYPDGLKTVINPALTIALQ